MSVKIEAAVRISWEPRQRIEDQAEVPCQTCDETNFILTKWQRKNLAWCVDIQCLQCGRSGGHPFKMAEHPDWERYPLFDKGLQDRWSELRRLDREAIRQDRQIDYSSWLKSSPDWSALRSKVLRRSGGLCEACLDAVAVDVHHTTYDYGRLPPAWLLRHVCRVCHERFTTAGDEWGPAE